MTDLIRILLIATSHSMMGDTGKPTGVWLEELAVPYYAFADAGYEVEIASIEGGKIPVDPRSRSGDAVEVPGVKRFLEDSDARAKLKNSTPLAEVDFSAYDAVFLPGGHGTMWDFPGNEELADGLGSVLADGRVVAAVCHGPAGLVGVTGTDGEPIVKGKRVAAFTDSEEDAVGLTDAVPFLLETRLRELGAEVVTAPDFQPHAVRDGRLITGQNPASSADAAQLVIEALKER